MFREFKRHYHKSKKIMLKVKDTCSLKINIDCKDNMLRTVNTIPTSEEAVQFIVLMRRFLNKNDKIYYKNIWNTIINKFPNGIPKSSLEHIENKIETFTRGCICININDDELSAEKIYTIISEGEYFNDNEAISKYLNGFKNIPYVGALFWQQFYSYTFQGFSLVSDIFDVIYHIEKGQKHKLHITTKKEKKRCIYCLETSASFTSEEHILPESIGNYDLVLDKGVVCDECNNTILSQLDHIFLKFEPISFLQVHFVPFTKSGKLPKANFQNMTIEKTHPRHIVITAKDKRGDIQNLKYFSDNSYTFDLNVRGKKFIPEDIGRALYKIALGMIAFDKGTEEACSNKYDKARDFIFNRSDFNNNLLLSTEIKLNPELRVHHSFCNIGTPFIIEIYGLIFMLNLEEEPKVEMSSEELSRLKFASFSLNKA